MQISLTRPKPSDKDRPVRAAWGRGKVAWGGVGLSRVEYHGTDAQASLGRVGPVRAAWGRGKVAWGGVGLSRVEYHGTDAEASLTSGRRPSGVGGYAKEVRRRGDVTRFVLLPVAAGSLLEGEQLHLRSRGGGDRGLGPRLYSVPVQLLHCCQGTARSS